MKNNICKTPLNSTDIIAYGRDHKENIGKAKATYMEGVLLGYGLRIQSPCVWEKQKMKHSSVMPTGGVYVKRCCGGIQSATINIEDMEDDLFCSSCGHIVKVAIDAN